MDEWHSEMGTIWIQGRSFVVNKYVRYLKLNSCLKFKNKQIKPLAMPIGFQKWNYFTIFSDYK